LYQPPLFEGGQTRDKIKDGFAKGLWHKIFQRLRRSWRLEKNDNFWRNHFRLEVWLKSC
jgi:hypothetical protein